MATTNTLARDIVAKVGTSADSDTVLGALNELLKPFLGEVLDRVSELVEAASAPVNWRNALVLEHHGIAKKAAKAFTETEYTLFMTEFDHSTCQVDYIDPESGQARHGCPARMKRGRFAEKSE